MLSPMNVDENRNFNGCSYSHLPGNEKYFGQDWLDIITGKK
jgi:hypothetical protein